MAPLSDFELTIGYIGGSVARGLICGLVTAIGIVFFIPLSIYCFVALLFYAIMGSLMMGSLGTMDGIWAAKWDQQQGITNFIVLPMTFLSGTFYSISRLPDIWKNFAAFNPFFYNIDGFRYAFIGKSDSSIVVGGVSLIIINSILVFLCFFLKKLGHLTPKICYGNFGLCHLKKIVGIFFCFVLTSKYATFRRPKALWTSREVYPT